MRTLAGFVKTLGSRLVHDDRGANLIEYGLIATLLALVVVPTLILLGPAVAALYAGVVGAF